MFDKTFRYPVGYHEEPCIGLNLAFVLRHSGIFSGTVDGYPGDCVGFVHVELADVFYLYVEF